MDYTLPEDNATAVPEQWFDRQLTRHTYKSPILRGFLDEEIAALKNYHSGKLSTDDAAHAITSPISNSPVPDLGTYSDDISAVCQLWLLLTDALVEWPSCRTEDLVSLLVAISKLPGGLHRGEALDEEEELLTWKDLPHIGMVWGDSTWMGPGILARRTPVTDHGAARQRVRLVYIKQQDVEAQLVREGILRAQRAFQYLIHTLEKIPGPQDEVDASDDADASYQLKLDFQVPAAACWLKHNGRMLRHGIVVKDELKDWEKRKIPAEAIQFSHPAERWTYWEKRLREIAESGPDDLTREAAETAIGYMQAADRQGKED
ncbi:hypothetical protein VMCG_07535 [Cytospora schulzeri]|uniref:Uncharacterized protein n=1 Tax=Cytospora schulzeri TaxID=448051 RepID=A0A423W184_9PEZI|nr:hypothetical protein VMCG_07535 [Valsa malicola]